MAKKPTNYQPQQRRRTRDTLREATPEPSLERIVTPEETMDRLVHMFEVDTIADGGIPDSYLGSLLASIVSGLSSAGQQILKKDDMLALIPDLVGVARGAADKLRERGYDRIHDHSAISRTEYMKLMLEEWQLYRENKHIPEDAIDFEDMSLNMEESDITRLQLEDAYDPQYNAFTTLLYIYGSSRTMSRANQSISIGGTLQEVRERSISHIERAMQQNPSTVRRDTTRTLLYLFSDEVDHFMDYFGYQDVPVQSSEKTKQLNDGYPVQELDFTVLPAGTNLHEFAAGIVTRLSEHEKAHVDLDRVNVLATIREYAGAHRCYYAHGKKSEKQMLDIETDTLIDEDYIVLVIQNLDETGTTQSEDALAISPIANKHAAYLIRSDASAGNWREILSLPKQDSRYFGARDLRFTGSSGRTPYSMMAEKIKALLACHPDDFRAKLRMRGDGTYRLDNCVREVGKAASKSLFDISL